MLNLHLSNRFEALLDRLADAAGAHAGGIFAPLPVVVPSAAVQRAVTLQLAQRLGVCAQVEFSFPAAWIWRQIAQAVPGVAAASPFDPDVLVWRVWRALGDAAFVAAHARLAAYVGRADDVMRFELAARCASLLEQYVTYRPDWLAHWSSGRPAPAPPGAPALPDEAWQAALWQRIAGELALADEHPAHAMLRALESGARLPLPPAVHVIGLPALPPLYVGVLQQLGRWIDVHVHALNPCRAYWLDVVGTRRLSWLASRPGAELFEQGNRLLADWGRQTQAFLGALLDVDDAVEDHAFVPAPRGSLLAMLQNAILDLEEPPPASFALAPSDRSVEVHVCHSATRELEVLHDHLLGRFAADPTLSPADVLVAVPDLPSVAPLIDAVFGTAPAARRIPFTVTGLPEREANPWSRLLLELLAFVRSRCAVTDLMALLQHDAVARRFGLDEAALEDLQAWMQGAGMHWALDARHRAEFDLPAADTHTLDDGLQRLFLGYAMPDATSAPFLGRLPAPGAQGSSARALGALAAVVDVARRLHDAAARPRPGAEWCRWLSEALDAIATPSRDDLSDLLQLRRSLHALQERMASGGAVDAVPLAVVQAALQRLLEEPARGGVPSGSVTFAPYGSLRGLPYRVVCAIGLNDGVVPSSTSPCEFDLMMHRPRPGDRQRSADDRNVFLDLVLAAREQLVLSYVGRSVRDNARLPPSVLVSELLDVLVGAVALDAPQARARLVVEHPLQPFSIACFTADDPRLRSFHAEYAQALRQAARAAAPLPPQAPQAPTPEDGDGDDEPSDDTDDDTPTDARAPFFRAPLPPADAAWHDVPITRLIEFFRNPSRFLLRQRMAIALPRPQDLLDDDEPLVPGFEQRSDLAARLLPHALAGVGTDALAALARAGVEYPAGALGRRQLDAELERLHDFAARVRADSAGPVRPPQRIEVDLEIDGVPWRVHGDFADLRERGRVLHRYDDTRSGDVLSGWLQHLLLCAGAPPGVQPLTRWHSRDGWFEFGPVDDARAALEQLVALHARGLARPLHFFPKSAWVYAVEGEDLAKARATWEASARRPHAEQADADHALALRGVDDPLDEEFVECARTVYRPLLACLRDPRR